MCGKPAVPNINAKPRDKASIGFAASLPGPIIFAASVKLTSCTLLNTSIDWVNMLLKLKPTPFMTMNAMKVAPLSNITALIICTHVVANIPPKIT
ncbi:hypothetical protein D3C76_1519600 [compost metagenome]